MVLFSNFFQKIAPRGWTKEINPLSQTPIYTNSRTGERVRVGREGGREGGRGRDEIGRGRGRDERGRGRG